MEREHCLHLLLCERLLGPRQSRRAGVGALLGVGGGQLQERRGTGGVVVLGRVRQVEALARTRHTHVGEPRLLGQLLGLVAGPGRLEAGEAALQPALVAGVEQRVGTGSQGEDAVGESRQEDDRKLEALGLVHGQHLHRLPRARRRLGVVDRPGHQGFQAGRQVGQAGLFPREALGDLLQLGEALDGGAQVGHALSLLEQAAEHAGLDEDRVGQGGQRQPVGAAPQPVVGGQGSAQALDLGWG